MGASRDSGWDSRGSCGGSSKEAAIALCGLLGVGHWGDVENGGDEEVCGL